MFSFLSALGASWVQNAANTTSNSVSPVLTEQEKIDDEPFIESLHDPTNATRKAIISVLCKGVYAYSSETQNVEPLMDELLQLCQRSSKLLSSMLQTPFINKQTPVKWALVNLHDRFFSAPSFRTTPTLIVALVTACEPFQSSIAREELMQQCCERNGNALFQLFNDKRRSDDCTKPYLVEVNNSSQRHVGRGVLQVCRVNFTIPNFPERMLIDGGVELQFIVQKGVRFFRFRATEGEKWEVSVSPISGSTNMNPYSGTIQFAFSRADGTFESPLEFTLDKTNKEASFVKLLEFQRTRNAIHTNGTLKGYVDFDWDAAFI